MAERMTDFALSEIEERGCSDDTPIHRDLRDLVSHLRAAYDEIDDPNYRYCGRIHRQAILMRNADIDRLRVENEALKAAIARANPEAPAEGQ